MHIVVLTNPAARGGAGGGGADAAARAVARLEATGADVAVLRPRSRDDADALLRGSLDGRPDAVLAVGGDGTANLALQHLAGTGTALGIVPTGTGNDLATALGLASADDAVDALLAGATRTIDLARVTRADGAARLYATVLACGFDARVNDRANRMRWPRGGSRYTVALLVEFARLRGVPFEIELETDAGPVARSGPLVMATVGNGPAYGGGIPICPDADLGDGLLDVTLVRPAGRLHLLRLLPHVYRGTHAALDEVETHRARRVRLRSPGATAYADGDPVGALPLTVEAVPAALTVLAPG